MIPLIPLHVSLNISLSEKGNLTSFHHCSKARKVFSSHYAVIHVEKHHVQF